MLILNSSVVQELMIVDNIVITVLGIKGKQARLGILAPVEVEVHRSEIYDKIQDEKTDDERNYNR